MSTPPTPMNSDRFRLRIRFQKEYDLRWISHRDLVRTFERLFRRAGLTMRMSEGFHPKPKMSFPSALAVGTASLDEVMELELSEAIDAQETLQRLTSRAPLGLTIVDVQLCDASQGKARIQTTEYQFPVPVERHRQVEQSIADLMAQPTCLIHREGRSDPIDAKTNLESIRLCDDKICFRIRSSHEASVRPLDLLQILGLTDLKQQGFFLTRSEVELTSGC